MLYLQGTSVVLTQTFSFTIAFYYSNYSQLSEFYNYSQLELTNLH